MGRVDLVADGGLVAVEADGEPAIGEGYGEGGAPAPGSKDGGVGEHVRKESGEFRCRWTARFFCRSGFLRRA